MKYEAHSFEVAEFQQVRGYSVIDCCLIKENEKKKAKVADFYTAVNGVYRFDNCDKTIFDISFYFLNPVTEQKIHLRTMVDLEELPKFRFDSLDYRLTLNPYPRARNDLLYFIKSQARTAPVKCRWYIDRIGCDCAYGKYIYCAGTEIFPIGTNTKKYFVDPIIKKAYHFDYDPDMTVSEALDGVFDYINIEPSKTAIIFSYAIVSVIRELFKQAGISPNTTLTVVGETQTHKTSAVTLSNNMYHRLSDLKFNTVRMDSSLSYIESMMYSFADSAVNLDDMHRDPYNYRQIESTSRAITREVGDNSSRMTMVNQKEIRSQVTMTAEYILKNTSDVGRMILLLLHEPLDSERLYRCQQNVLAISSFMRFFISWVYTDFENTVEKIREDLKELRRWQIKNASKYSRLDEYKLILESTFSLFLEFAVHEGYFPENEAKQEYLKFKAHTDHWKEVQIMVLNKISRETGLNKVNYAQAIIALIENGDIKIDPYPSESSDCFEGWGKNVHTAEKSPCLFIRSEYLMQKLNYFLKERRTVNFYVKYLSERCLLSHDKDCNYCKRFKTRYLAINVDLLKVEAQSEEYKIEKLFR